MEQKPQLIDIEPEILTPGKPTNPFIEKNRFYRLLSDTISLDPFFHNKDIGYSATPKPAIKNAVMKIGGKTYEADSHGQAMEILEKLHEDGHTIILVTHETYTAEYAHRLIKIKDGLVEFDELVEQKHKHQNGFLK